MFQQQPHCFPITRELLKVSSFYNIIHHWLRVPTEMQCSPKTRHEQNKDWYARGPVLKRQIKKCVVQQNNPVQSTEIYMTLFQESPIIQFDIVLELLMYRGSKTWVDITVRGKAKVSSTSQWTDSYAQLPQFELPANVTQVHVSLYV